MFVYRVCDLNIGRVVLGDQREGFTSPVAEAVLELLARHGAYLFVCVSTKCIRIYELVCEIQTKMSNFIISKFDFNH